MSSRTTDAENHRLLLTSSPVYNSFLKNTEIILYKFNANIRCCCLSRPRVPARPRVPRPTSPSPTSSSPRILRPTSPHPASHVPASCVPRPRIPRHLVLVLVPEPTPHVPALTSQSPRPRPTFSHSRRSDDIQMNNNSPACSSECKRHDAVFMKHFNLHFTDLDFLPTD